MQFLFEKSPNSKIWIIACLSVVLISMANDLWFLIFPLMMLLVAAAIGVVCTKSKWKNMLAWGIPLVLISLTVVSFIFREIADCGSFWNDPSPGCDTYYGATLLWLFFGFATATYITAFGLGVLLKRLSDKLRMKIIMFELIAITSIFVWRLLLM